MKDRLISHNIKLLLGAILIFFLSNCSVNKKLERKSFQKVLINDFANNFQSNYKKELKLTDNFIYSKFPFETESWFSNLYFFDASYESFISDTICQLTNFSHFKNSTYDELLNLDEKESLSRLSPIYKKINTDHYCIVNFKMYCDTKNTDAREYYYIAYEYLFKIKKNKIMYSSLKKETLHVVNIWVYP